MNACLHPVTVQLPYGGSVKVPCHKCSYCRNHAGDLMVQQLDVEHLSHKHVFFATMTYNEQNVPVVSYSTDGCQYSYFTYTNKRIVERLAKLGESPTIQVPIEEVCFDSHSASVFSKKFKRDKWLIPVLYREDCKMFMKRVRIKLKRILNNYDNETLRIYYCGEYGPKHFRPHYHFLFFTNSDECAAALRQIVYESWQFGSVRRFERSKGKGNSYVSRYCVGTSDMPRVFRVSKFCPYQQHSIHFGHQVLPSKGEIISKGYSRLFDGETYTMGDKLKSYSPPRSYISALFPKCYGYGRTTSFEHKIIYGIYDRALLEAHLDGIDRLTIPNISLYLSARGEDSETFRILSRALHQGELLESSILSILQTSSLVLRNCKKYDIAFDDYVDYIDSYYRDLDMYCLRTQLKNQANFGRTYVAADPRNALYYANYYDNVYVPKTCSLGESIELDNNKVTCVRFFDSLGFDWELLTDEDINIERNPYYSYIRLMSEAIASTSIKHKEQNDANASYLSY